MSSFIFLWELKLESDFLIFILGSYFPWDLKQKCSGHWGFLHHLYHLCLICLSRTREYMQLGNGDRYGGSAGHDTDDSSKILHRFLARSFSKPEQNNLSSK